MNNIVENIVLSVPAPAHDKLKYELEELITKLLKND